MNERLHPRGGRLGKRRERAITQLQTQATLYQDKIPPPAVSTAPDPELSAPNKTASAARPRRAIRIEDSLWHAAQRQAADRGETVSEVVRRSLHAYLESDL